MQSEILSTRAAELNIETAVQFRLYLKLMEKLSLHDQFKESLIFLNYDVMILSIALRNEWKFALRQFLFLIILGKFFIALYFTFVSVSIGQVLCG